MKKIRKYSIVALIINIIIFLSMVGALVWFLYETTNKFTDWNYRAFRYFTTDSNIFMGLVALILIPFNIKSIKHNRECTPSFFTKLNLAATTSVTLTFLTVVCFLAPLEINKGGYFSMFTKSNFVYHFLIPVLAIINFTLFETRNRLKFRHCFYSLIPMVLFACFYITYQVMHMNGNKLDKQYDFYHFIYGDSIYSALYTSLPIMLAVTFLFSFLLFLAYYYRRKHVYKLAYKYQFN